jgi:hypothetical protein
LWAGAGSVNLCTMTDPTPEEPIPGASPPPPPDPSASGPPPFAAPGTYPPPGYAAGPPPGVWAGPRPRGPIGEPRAAGLTILLTIVTCGIWTILWSMWTHEEMKRYRGDGIGGVAAALLAAFVPVVVMFTVPMEIELMYREEGQEPPVTTLLGLWFLLPIIGNFIWYLQVQRALNEFWIAHGAPPPN